MNTTSLLAQSGYGQTQISDPVFFAIIGVAVLLYFFFSYCLMKIAEKTGTDGGWMGFIPLLQIILLLRIGDKPAWYLILAFIPILNIYISIMLWVWVAEALGRSTVLAGLAALTGIGLLFLVPSYAFSD